MVDTLLDNQVVGIYAGHPNAENMQDYTSQASERYPWFLYFQTLCGRRLSVCATEVTQISEYEWKIIGRIGGTRIEIIWNVETLQGRFSYPDAKAT